MAVADQLARSLVRPLTAVARVSDRLATGDLTARATVAGPPEVRRAGTGLNRLAARIGDLLAHERETVADLSHRLRTPLTALRIDAESLRDEAEMAQVLADVDIVERTVTEIIREARRPTGEGSGVLCDASDVVGERAAFWQPLAEDQERPMTVDIARRSGDGAGQRRGPGRLHGHPAGERVLAYPRRPGLQRQAHPAGGRRRLAAGRRRRARLPGRQPDPARPVQRRLLPGWAWISPGGSPRTRAAASPSATPPPAARR